MTVEILSRSRGAVIRCTACKQSMTTGQIQIKILRTYAKSIGWGRGSDPGTPYRAPRPARASVRGIDGKVIERAQPALAEIPGRPRTTGYDLCPDCLKIDLDAMAERKRAREAKAEERLRRQTTAIAPQPDVPPEPTATPSPSLMTPGQARRKRPARPEVTP